MKKYLILLVSLVFGGMAWAGSGDVCEVDRVQGDDLPRAAVVDEIISPSRDKVYVETDTVIIRVCNTGTESLWDIPVAFSCYTALWDSLMPTGHGVIHDTLRPNQCTVFKFNDLIVLPEEYRNTDESFTVVAWAEVFTDSPNEIEETTLDFYTLNGDDAYCIPYSVMVGYYNSYINIVGVNFNSLSNEVIPLGWSLGFGMMNFAKYEESERLVPALHVMRGLEDSLIVHVATNDITMQWWDGFDTVNPCKILVAIDYNRDGSFDEDEILCRSQFFGQRFALPVTISPSADFGYMRMRVLVIQGNDDEPEADELDPCMQIDRISAQDYLLYVEEKAPVVDASLNRMITIESPIITEAAQSIVVSISNCGSTSIENPIFHYDYVSVDASASRSGTFAWQGTLAPGRSTAVTLPEHHFPLGTTEIQLSIDVTGDVNASNNAIAYKVHRFHTVRCPYFDDFENDARSDYWFAVGNNYAYNHNFWTFGTPSRNVIDSSHSGTKAWSTDFSDVAAASRGIHNFLYSPLIDVSVVSPDTLSFFLYSNFMSEAFMALEYLDKDGEWKMLISSYVGSSDGYEEHLFVINDILRSRLGRITQFRFCYTTDFRDELAIDGDGCAIDDFSLSHIVGDVDVAVYEVSTPLVPQRGKKIYPIMVITNLGSEIVSDVVVEYCANNGDTIREIHEGELLPGQIDTHYFATSFVCDASFPKTFSICANTSLPSDTLKHNDTLCSSFTIGASDDDLEVSEYVSPRLYAVTHDSADVMVRLCNNGDYPVEQAEVYFQFNGRLDTVSEIDFVQLVGGDGLEGGQCYDYNVPGHYYITIGYTSLLTIVTMPGDVNRANDTLESIFQGLTNVVDLEAIEVVVDDADASSIRLRLGLRNMGAQPAEDYYIGFYLDGDASRLYRQHITSSPLESHEVLYIPFDTTLGSRANGYANITAFVSIEDDIDNDNDTTTKVVKPMIDLAALSVVVNETNEGFCKVSLRLQNQGNTTADNYHVSAVVNGVVLEMDSYVPIAPQQIVDVVFESSIEKVSSGYSGSGRVSCVVDENSRNDTTAIVVIKGRTDGILDIEDASLWLGQNQPNPCRTETVIPFYFSVPTQATLSVFDGAGRMVHQTSVFYPQGSHTYTLWVSGWAAGVYHYVLVTPSGRRVMKLVVR